MKTAPDGPLVIEAEALVLAERSPRAARYGVTQDASLGDLLMAMMGKTAVTTLEQVGAELAYVSTVLLQDQEPVDVFEAGTLLRALVHRVAAYAELHRRIRRARRAARDAEGDVTASPQTSSRARSAAPTASARPAVARRGGASAAAKK